MIRLRDDDVLVASSAWNDPFGRFRQVHEWIAAFPDLLHVPAILIEGTAGPAGKPEPKGLQDYPECIAYIREETRAGRMAPELHGWFHIDYAALSFRDVYEQLIEARLWMLEALDVDPKIWYTPWGADTEDLRLAAKAAGYELVGSHKENAMARALSRIREHELNPQALRDGVELDFHWWEGGARVKRFAKVVEHGSWQAAAKAEPELFRE